MKKRILCVCMAMVLFAPLVGAGGGGGLRRTFIVAKAWMRAPKRSLDSNYVFQPRNLWAVGLETTSIGTYVGMDCDMTTYTRGEDGTTLVNHPELNCTQEGRVKQKIGASVSFGMIRLSLGTDLTRNKTKKNSYFSLGTTNSTYGLQARYYRIYDNVTTNYLLEGPDGNISNTTLTSTLPALTRSLSLDGYYVFEHKKFDYTSAYSGKKIQRRSAGSWLLAGRYVQGDLRYNPDDVEILELMKNVGCFTTQQVSVGGGYSYNWVPWHRNPASSGLRGLRNLTLNVTAMPMATFYNHFRLVNYVHTDYNKWTDLIKDIVGDKSVQGEINRLEGRPSATILGRVAMCFTWNAFSLNATMQYNQFFFHGASHNNWSQEAFSIGDMSMKGTFTDWTGKVMLLYRF